MMDQKERIKNSIRGYILGDCLGVPYEFQRQGYFMPELFKGFGTYNKPAGTWSDDTTVLLCLLDAFSQENSVEVYKNNLRRWFFNGEFTIDGLFDIGIQTSEAIRCNFCNPTTENMGNGALFYSLPLAIVNLYKKVDFKQWCFITHNNINCFITGSALFYVLGDLISDRRVLPLEKNHAENKGDVINTYKLVLNEFIEARAKETSIMTDLLKVISYGEDTDTNAAILGALLGTVKPIQEEDWQKVRENGYIDMIVDKFLEQF